MKILTRELILKIILIIFVVKGRKFVLAILVFIYFFLLFHWCFVHIQEYFSYLTKIVLEFILVTEGLH